MSRLDIHLPHSGVLPWFPTPQMFHLNPTKVLLTLLPRLSLQILYEKPTYFQSINPWHNKIGRNGALGTGARAPARPPSAQPAQPQGQPMGTPVPLLLVSTSCSGRDVQPSEDLPVLLTATTELGNIRAGDVRDGEHVFVRGRNTNRQGMIAGGGLGRAQVIHASILLRRILADSIHPTVFTEPYLNSHREPRVPRIHILEDKSGSATPSCRRTGPGRRRKKSPAHVSLSRISLDAECSMFSGSLQGSGSGKVWVGRGKARVL